MLMVLSYGKGRIFHTTLGHDVPALSCVGFIATFQRGTEWAATGGVSYEIELNFRYVIQVSLHRRLSYKGRAPVKSAILATDCISCSLRPFACVTD